jgi:hypothetical protein
MEAKRWKRSSNRIAGDWQKRLLRCFATLNSSGV